MKNHKPLRLQQLTKALYHNSRQWLLSLTISPEQPDKPGNLPESLQDELPPKSVRYSFSSELFAELLTELPDYQLNISQAYQDGDQQRLRDNVHQLLGAIVYCDAPELESALRALHRALATTDTDIIDTCYIRTINTINNTLTYSGFAGYR